jgi:hypothetical protein
MAITASEQQELHDWILLRGCSEFRTGRPCVQRGNTPMVGDMHKPCAEVVRMLEIVDNI